MSDVYITWGVPPPRQSSISARRRINRLAHLVHSYGDRDLEPPKEKRARDEAQHPLDHRHGEAMVGFAASLSDEAVRALRRSPEVERIEPDQEVSILETQQRPTWGLDRIDQRALPGACSG
jgi:hypothetical protein